MRKLFEVRNALDEEKGYYIAVFLALVIVAAVVAGYYILGDHAPEEYNTISLLDRQKQAIDYPEVVLASQNNNLSVYVNVENHMNSAQNYMVQTKIAKNLPASLPNGLEVDPINTYRFSLATGETHQNLVTAMQDIPGNYAVVFELWRDSGSGVYVFTQNYCVLNIHVK
ncbi:DUF1616 domain-containing protein [Candidatus Bathycorpusculum sp.]|uniref:DUF1616 domain-containing protein n=1 Tax=Candidatus Bathycorpusculum sp. TaxID=2994959 RepID=UPI0028292A78|nr:DUF1616 domain-containing protein [Candidatus Termitimicrobium sp.]MCL2431187.1 DUF1616 domain-containing protein [Candidatus Termitimicrobium sp.]